MWKKDGTQTKRVWKPKTILEKVVEIKVVQDYQNKEKLLEEEEKSQNNEDSRTQEKEECEDPMNGMVIYLNKDLVLEGFEDLEETEEGEILEERSGQLDEFEVSEESQKEDLQTLSRYSRQELLILEDVLEPKCMDLFSVKIESKQK